MARVCFFCFSILSHLYSLIFFFLSFHPKSFIILIWASYIFLALGFLKQRSLTVILWVCIFRKVLLKKRWTWGQQKSVSQTMALDCKPILASTLTIFCIIFIKLVNTWSYCSILNLIEGLKPSRKYRIMVGLFEAVSALNSIKIN